MKKNIIKYSFFFLLSMFAFETYAQTRTTNTLYFMENAVSRQTLNPAFQPKSKVFIGLPVIGYTQVGVGNNSFSLKDIVYNNANNQPISFLHPDGDKNKFYDVLRPNTLLGADFRTNLLSIGFRTNDTDYWTFSSSVRGIANTSIPKSFMELLLFGTREKEKNNHFNLRGLGADIMAFTDVSLAYSKQINEKWGFGVKGSFLLGHAHLTVDNKMTLDASIQKWHTKGDGKFNFTLPGEMELTNDFKIKTAEKFKVKDFFNGFGVGFDLGTTYKPINPLTLSASLTDIGLIYWGSKNAYKGTFDAEYSFEGLDFNSDRKAKEQLEDIVEEFKNNANSSRKQKGYSSCLLPKLHLGAEYAFFDNKLSLGLLSRTGLYKRKLYEELTVSANARATNWLDFSLSYSVLNGRASNIGAGIGLRTGVLQWVLAADYVPLQYAPYKAKDKQYLIPYNTKEFNLSLGVNIVIGNKQDKDRDGVKDRFDFCPETPRGVVVDDRGCPIDTDGDGTPDYLDKCPDTPEEARGFVDENGCPKDSDGDGIHDYQDKCPDTPEAAKGYIDDNGCPKDSDGDGVPDYLDKCPGTAVAARGFVDENGCPKDSDGDGVPDYLDKCPNTPAEVKEQIDANGCAKDSDGDGVPDYLDKCPGTPAAARGFVDNTGCPKDTDGDGIPDYLDNCPTIKGVKANHGCPELKKEEKRLFQQALQGIQFETGKSVIKKTSYPILNKIVDVLLNNPEYRIEVQGHTDNTGNVDRNLQLSKERAESVRQYLIGKGVDESRIKSNGYGITRPIADNKTPAGRAKNRRVEFVVSFEKMVQE